MSKQATVVITATLPRGVTAKAFRDYAQTEVGAGVGGLHPDDPLFHLDRDSVHASTLKADPRVRALLHACDGLLDTINLGGGGGSVIEAAEKAIAELRRAA